MRPHRVDLPGLRIALYGEFGIGNAGNDESARSLTHLLRTRSVTDLTLITLAADQATKSVGLPALQFTASRSPATGSAVVNRAMRAVGKVSDFSRMIRLVGGFDGVIVAGTGLLEAPRGRYPGGDLIWLAMLSVACRIRRVPLAWFAIGGGHFASPIPGRFAAVVARAAQIRSYRDTLTRDSLAQHGLNVKADPVVTDVVFSRGEVTETPRNNAEPRQVAVGPIDMPAHLASDGPDSYLERLAQLITRLHDRGVEVRLVLGDSADGAVAVELLELLPMRKIRITSGPEFSDVLADLRDHADVVVASRYHVLIAGMLTGVPTVALSHADKDESLLRRMGQGRYLHSAAAFVPESVERDIFTSHQNRSRIRAQVATAIEQGRKSAEDELQRVLLYFQRRVRQ